MKEHRWLLALALAAVLAALPACAQSGGVLYRQGFAGDAVHIRLNLVPHR